MMDVVGEDEDLLESISNRERIQALRCAIDSCLTDQERQVVLLRYGMGGAKAHRQREVAQMLGISRSYVSRIEKRALQKLRKELAESAW